MAGPRHILTLRSKGVKFTLLSSTMPALVRTSVRDALLPAGRRRAADGTSSERAAAARQHPAAVDAVLHVIWSDDAADDRRQASAV